MKTTTCEKLQALDRELSLYLGERRETERALEEAAKFDMGQLPTVKLGELRLSFGRKAEAARTAPEDDEKGRRANLKGGSSFRPSLEEALALLDYYESRAGRAALEAQKLELRRKAGRERKRRQRARK